MCCKRPFLTLMQMDFAPAKPEHYCVRSFRNRALNHRRSLWRRLSREWESLRWFEKSASGETPAEREAMRCLAELPQEQREAIVLKLWHGNARLTKLAGCWRYLQTRPQAVTVTACKNQIKTGRTGL
jgi:hypothetical protein